jgi:hypothetical protein
MRSTEHSPLYCTDQLAKECLGGKIAIHYAVPKKRINPLCRENVEGFGDKTNGAYGNHRTLKGYSP